MISLPVVVHNNYFEWQLDLFWHSHKTVYGNKAEALALIVKRNYDYESSIETMQWDMDVPHFMCEPFFEWLDWGKPVTDFDLPLNIQTALDQTVHFLDPDEVLEVLDGDMCHISESPDTPVADDEIYVDAIYEWWHLKSLSTNRRFIEIYFENGGKFYNGGFVPIIGKAKTFAKILPEWIEVHKHMLAQNYEPNIKWWSGMFALQVACEKSKVLMIAKDYCYVPVVNQLARTHYVAHYAVDNKFDKRKFPDLDISSFENNVFYKRVSDWLKARAPTTWYGQEMGK
jgi:hypothetical protein